MAAGLAFAGCLSTRGPSAPLDAEAPEFTLTSQEGKEVSLSHLLHDGPAVLVFYRGYW
jgi:peroxiredoxin